MSKRASNAYRQAQLGTAGPTQKVVFLYEAIIKDLKNAQASILNMNDDPKQIEVAHQALTRVERIILELQIALDMERGGEIATNLNDLYSFWIGEISRCNSDKQAKTLDPIIKMAEELRDTWKEAGKLVSKPS